MKKKDVPSNIDEKAQYYWTHVQRHGAKYPFFKWPSVEVLLNLFYTYEVIGGLIDKQLAVHTLSRTAFNILLILSRNENKSYSQKEISKLMLVSPANVTGLIDSLTRQDLVTRVADPHDRRVWLLKITPKGEELLEQILPSHYKNIDRLTAGLSKGEKEDLSQLLTQLREGARWE